jgi:hypothetical protein
MYPLLRTSRTAGTTAIMFLALGCDARSFDPQSDGSTTGSFAAAAPPVLQVQVPVPGGTLSIWPYTGTDFSGTPQDPINLVFAGSSDPRAIRTALMALDGNRTAFGMPAEYPFNCTWSDAIGDLQTGYNATAQWVGSAVQLACGTYGPIRFHVRLFEGGTATLGNAHFEVLIPGTADHQVLSWELAEQLVKVDFVRSGLLDKANPLAATSLINDSPFRTIPEPIYNGLPAELKALIGGPAGSVGSPVPIATDGRATIFNVAATPSEAPRGSDQSFVLQYGQVIPRPFCASGPEFLYVEGPVSLRKTVQVSGAGDLSSAFDATGHLRLTPVNPLTGAPIGPTYEADVSDHQVGTFDDRGGRVDGVQVQTELPRNVSGHGQKVVRLKVGLWGSDKYRQDIDCTP